MIRLVLPGLSVVALAAVMGSSAPALGSPRLVAWQDTIVGKLSITPTRKDDAIKISDKKDLELAIMSHTALNLDDIDKKTVTVMGVPARNFKWVNTTSGSASAVSAGAMRSTNRSAQGMETDSAQAHASEDMVFVVGIPQLAPHIHEGRLEICATGLTVNLAPFKACSDLTVDK